MSIDDELAIQMETKNLHTAIHWLMEQAQPLRIEQIEEASKRFNLSPRSEEILLTYFTNQQPLK